MPTALHDFKSLGLDEIHFRIRKGLVDVLTRGISEKGGEGNN